MYETKNDYEMIVKRRIESFTVRFRNPKEKEGGNLGTWITLLGMSFKGSHVSNGKNIIKDEKQKRMYHGELEFDICTIHQ